MASGAWRNAVQPDGEAILAQITELSRTPFREILSRALSAEPTPQAIRKFAAKYPDRWAQMLTMLAKLSGYNDKIEVDTSLIVQVRSLSDAELLGRLAELQRRVTLTTDITPKLSITESNDKKPSDSE